MILFHCTSKLKLRAVLAYHSSCRNPVPGHKNPKNKKSPRTLILSTFSKINHQNQRFSGQKIQKFKVHKTIENKHFSAKQIIKLAFFTMKQKFTNLYGVMCVCVKAMQCKSNAM